MVHGKISVIGHGPVYDREVLSEVVEEMFVTCFYCALNDWEGSYGDDHEGRCEGGRKRDFYQYP